VVRHLSSLGRAASIAAATIGAVVFVGWALDLPALERAHPSPAWVKVNAALIAVALGASLWIQRVLRSYEAKSAAETALRETAEALRVSEARFRRLAESGLLGIITSTPRGDILDANDAFLAIVGYTREELVSRKVRWADMTPPEWRHLDAAAIEQLRATGVAPAWEKEYVRKDGSRVPILVGVAALEGASAERVAFILDLTERKRAEESIRHLEEQRAVDAKFRALLEAAPDAMVIVRTDGTIALVNAQTEKLFGYSREELLGASVDVLVPERLRGRHAGHRAGFTAAPKARAMAGAELLAMRKDGTEFAIEATLSPLDTADGALVSSAIRDITERKRAEAELRRTKEAAEAASRELEAFSYTVAHDLRAPLRAISGFSAALIEDLGPKLDAESKDYLERIGDEASRMEHLITALLGLSRVSRAEVRREPVDLARLAEAVVARLRAADPEAAVELVTDEDLVAQGDPALLRVLLENLLGNGWKFASKGPSPRIELRRSQDGESPIYVVRDNGAGFNMEYADKLFAPFHRLHSADEFPGSGIGLATAQRIVTRHGGRIWAEGAPGKGASFYFTLGSGDAKR